jgi:hypothetical protein
MMSFYALSALIRAQFTLWALLLCLAAVIGIVYAAFLKKSGFAVLASLSFASAYSLWQIMVDIYTGNKTGTALAVSVKLGGFPWLLWLLALAVITLTITAVLVLSARHVKMRVTPMAIKHCADQMPCGICCWRDSGRVIFSNICMNRLCVALTGRVLLNGNSFRSAVPDSIMTVNGREWRFVCRDLCFDGECLHEMIASDITEEYAKTKALEKDMTEIARMNRELQAYNLRIDEAVRRQEILQVKVNIHDEMNRLILSTVADNSADRETLDQIFSLWEKNTMLLCRQADEDAGRGAANRLEQLARALDIRLIWRTSLPNTLTKKQRELFFTAAQEAVANAVKHAGAKAVEISFSEAETAICCDFENDGRMPAGNVRFTGGLANLAYLAGEEGASVLADIGKTFKLSLRFAKES